MKKLTFIIIILITAVYSVSAQTGDKETLKQLNQNLVAAHAQGNFDEALKFARQTLDLSLKVFGAESVETAIAYKNIGVIYQEKMKFRESIENLQKSLAIYQKIDGQNGKYLAGAHEALAISYSFAEKKKEAEENY